jgi:hypothetical protein
MNIISKLINNNRNKKDLITLSNITEAAEMKTFIKSKINSTLFNGALLMLLLFGVSYFIFVTPNIQPIIASNEIQSIVAYDPNPSNNNCYNEIKLKNKEFNKTCVRFLKESLKLNYYLLVTKANKPLILSTKEFVDTQSQELNIQKDLKLDNEDNILVKTDFADTFIDNDKAIDKTMSVEILSKSGYDNNLILTKLFFGVLFAGVLYYLYGIYKKLNDQLLISDDKIMEQKEQYINNVKNQLGQN